MRIPVIMIIAMLSIVADFTIAQQAPAEEQVEQQVEQTVTQEVQPEEAQQEQVAPVDDSSENISQETAANEPIETAQEATTESVSVTNEEQAAEAPVEPIVETTTTESENILSTIPTEPEPVEDEPVVIPENEPEIEATGIDTVSLENPQGNWLFKRIWWERAEERYEKIRLLVDAIWDSRTAFFIKRNDLDRNILDPFYLSVGIGQGELQVILTEINDFLEKKREQQGDLNEQERMLYESYATEEETLKQLKQDVESIANLDNEIDNALGTLMNQINRVRQFEDQAWQHFREIARILNDTKARELYYIIEGAARNIKNISTYLERDFITHFNTLISEATKHVARVQGQIEALKEKGIHFKRQVDLLEQQNQNQQEDEDDEDDEEVAPKPKLGWFGWIIAEIKNAFGMILSILSMPYNMLFGK